jgi:hypothetical protein
MISVSGCRNHRKYHGNFLFPNSLNPVIPVSGCGNRKKVGKREVFSIYALYISRFTLFYMNL